MMKLTTPKSRDRRYRKLKTVAPLVALVALGLFPLTAYSGGVSFLIDLAAKRNNFVAPVPCPADAIVVSNLRTPTKLILTQHGSLLIAEAGSGSNNGRLSLVDPTNGNRRTLLDGLPSGFTYPSNISSGPSGLAMRGRSLYLSIGEGDSTLYGTVPGTHLPNPIPSSPIFSSVLAIDFTPHVEQTTAGFTLTLSDHFLLRNGAEVNLDNGGGDKMRIRLVADFTDYIPEPRPNEVNNVRPSDPYGVALTGNQLYVADGGSNSIRVVDLQSGDTETLINFAPLPNPQVHASGPATARALPVNIRFLGDQLLATLMTAPPFPRDAAQVRIVDPANGGDAPFITGLTLATDVLPIRGRGPTEFLTLELDGHLRRYAAPGAAPVTIADCLTTPTSMALDGRTGTLYIAEILSGNVIKIGAPSIPGAVNAVFVFEPQILAGARK